MDEMKVKEPPPERPSLVAVVGVAAICMLDNFFIPPSSPSTAKSERQPALQLNMTRKAHESDTVTQRC
jgi:hypothetical protein